MSRGNKGKEGGDKAIGRKSEEGGEGRRKNNMGEKEEE